MLRSLPFAVVVALSLSVAGTALGANYWFYQGNLPTSGGTRYVLLGSSPPTPIYQRESWSSCTHSMKYIRIQTNGSWNGGTFYYSNGCDQEVFVDFPEFYNNYGCENPSGLSQVYVNCRAGTGP